MKRRYLLDGHPIESEEAAFTNASCGSGTGITLILNLIAVLSKGLQHTTDLRFQRCIETLRLGAPSLAGAAPGGTIRRCHGTAEILLGMGLLLMVVNLVRLLRLRDI